MPCKECGQSFFTDVGRAVPLGHAEELHGKLNELVRAVLYTTELYAEPLRYEVKGKLKPNLSIGFETRYQEMFDLAVSLKEES